MDTSSIILIILSPLCGSLGYAIKLFLTKRSEKNKLIQQDKISNIKYMLEKFYFPIYTNLLRENAIWYNLICIRRKNNQLEIIKELDKEILKIHLENQKIIQDNLISINPTNELTRLLTVYDQHVTIYEILRKTGSMDFPAKYNTPYPHDLLSHIGKKLDALKAERDNIYDFIV